MAVSSVTKLYSTEDAKIQRLLTDPVGGTATYGPLIDIPGIRQVGLTPQIESKQLRGDNRELDNDSTLVACEISWEQAKLSYEALAALLGGTFSSGRYVRKGSDAIPSWRMGWKTPTSGGDDIDGDVHFGVTKGKITAYTLGTAFEDYQILTATARCVFRASDDELFDITPHEAATALASA